MMRGNRAKAMRRIPAGVATAGAPFVLVPHPSSTLQRGTHNIESPVAVLSQAERVDVAALLAPRGNPNYRGWPAASELPRRPPRATPQPA